ncbi:MAG: M12 family metallo-peptidase [Thermoanaerobaculia bacterium]|nr:M12 family metallo-peptidase [Thermoanaerobaculia bacterium]
MKKMSQGKVGIALALGFSLMATAATAEGPRSKGAATGGFAPVALFEDLGSVNAGGLETALQKASEGLTEGTYLKANHEVLARLAQRAPQQLRLLLPFEGRTLELDLTKVNLFAPGFSVVDQNDRVLAVELGAHYDGVIVGERGSRVALSLYRDQIAGMAYSTQDGNVMFGRVDGEEFHIAFSERHLTRQPEPFACATDHRRPDARVPQELATAGLFESETLASTSTVNIYLEATNGLRIARGGTQGATTYVTTIFNLSRQLYANERIPVAISQLRINTAADGYGTNVSTNLSRFQSARSATFPGQLAQLVGSGSQGGIAAGFAGFCASNRRNSMCTSQLDGTSASLPTWNYSVEVFTHELGHLMGSRHTHACVWNGNNTAIDGCSGFVEGSCALPNVPASQGTIMSYCRGFSFNNGFGSQPGNVIRSRYAAASCF